MSHARRLALRTMFVLCAVVAGVLPAAAQTIGGYVLVSQQRFGPITFLTYRATLSNAGGPALLGATATVTSSVRATIVLDNQLTFGPVAAGGSALSQDTISLMHVGRPPFSLAALRWTVTTRPAPVTRSLRIQSIPSVRSGDVFAVVVEALSGGSVDATFSGDITISATAAGGSEFGGGNKVVTAVNGVATFGGLLLNNAANGYVVTATAASANPGTSNTFDVTAHHLQFVNQPPGSVRAGDAFGVTVEARDANDNLAENFTGSVGLSAAAIGGSNFNGGNAASTAAAGVAIFTGLILNNAASGYGIDASAAGGILASSSAFIVAARQLAVLTVANQTAGAPFDVVVEARDGDGNIAENFTGTVTLLASSAQGDDFETPPMASSFFGVTSFTGVILETAATGYSIIASATSLLDGTSNLFDVVAIPPPDPGVIVVSPRDGDTDVTPEAMVVVTFPRPVNPATLTSTNIRLMSGGNPLFFQSIGHSIDGRSVYLRSMLGLPANAVIDVVVTDGVEDFSDDPIGPFASAFTTANTATSRPRVVSQQPASGNADVPAGSAITMFLDSAIDPSTLAAALYVTSTGQPVGGTASASASGLSVTFTPAASLSPGALIEVTLDTTALDLLGRSFRHHTGHFRVAGGASTTPPQLIALSPASGSTDNPLNTVIGLRFDHRLDPSTVNASTVIVRNAVGDPIAGSLTLVNERVIRFTPAALLDPFSTVSIEVTTGVEDVDGRAFAGANASFTTGLVEDTVAPLVIVAMQSINVPVDAEIRIAINPGPGQFGFELIDPTSIDATTVTITAAGGGQIAASIRLNETLNELIVTPHVPLPPSTAITVTVTGVRDRAGNVANTAVLTFMTMAGGPIP